MPVPLPTFGLLSIQQRLGCVLLATISTLAVSWQVVLDAEAWGRSWAGQTSDENQKDEEVREQTEHTQKFATPLHANFGGTDEWYSDQWVLLELNTYFFLVTTAHGTEHSRAPPRPLC